eukprot:CAMPEP_0171453842 /NCGR_PEP_ID=MMETSP0945-20130129/1383_1 /TAXON_ID=109269 /ORGANISM="Vaucheria litorea, Strain CCMP2940" /LENGTH=125 /DNA_ID=CAMNT_0011978779 /DNA_START=149 /DNA_END=523 /DNA_ORIENTATION=+
MNHSNIFVYGTLMDERVVRRLIDRAPIYRSATLLGFHRYRIVDKVYPGIRQKHGGRVDGFLIALSKDEERIIDEFEGHCYCKEKVAVECDGSLVNCQTYVWAREMADQLYDSWDFNAHFAPHVEW